MSEILNYQALHTATGIAKMQIMSYLYRSKDGTASMSDLMTALNREQTNVSHHIAWLERAGLVKDNGRFKGKRRYSIADPAATYAILSAETYLTHTRKMAERKSRKSN